MKPNIVDLVFVIDASDSMRPCIEGLANNLNQVIQPLNGYSFKLRFGLLGMNVGRSDSGGRLINITTLAGNMDPIYQGSPDIFTEDPQVFARAIRSLDLGGDEHHLIALDTALDFPFGPVHSTRRVVCLFSDEKIEDGFVAQDLETDIIEKIAHKAMARKVQLFAALPDSPALQQLSGIPQCQIETVNGGDGLRSLNFSKLLGQMGKSISVSSLQGNELPFEKGLFGQMSWVSSTGSFEGMR